MVKYSLETKLKAVNSVLELHMSVRTVPIAHCLASKPLYQGICLYYNLIRTYVW